MFSPGHVEPPGYLPPPPPPTSFHPQLSQPFTSSHQAQQQVRVGGPFSTGNTPTGLPLYGPGAVGYPFGPSALMPSGGWASTPPRSPYDPDNPPFSGLKTYPVMLSELGILKETCLELSYHSALQFAMIFKAESNELTRTHDVDTANAFKAAMEKLYIMITWCNSNGVMEDGNYAITPDIRHCLELAFRWVYMYNFDLDRHKNGEVPGYGLNNIIHIANAALAMSPHDEDVLRNHVMSLPFFPVLLEEFDKLKSAIDRKNLREEFSMAVAPFRPYGGRGLRHKLRRHYKLTRRHKPKRHYKLTRRHKP
jgi:hypothetical protein